MQDKDKGSIPALAYLCSWVFDFHHCTGSPDIGGYHIEITQVRRHEELRARHFSHQPCDGRIANLFKDYVSIDRLPIEASYGCWRVKEGKRLCPGERIDYNDLVISLPIIFTIEVDHERGPKVWEFPETLHPLTKEEAADHGLEYTLVGLALVSTTLTTAHFLARHSSADHKTIYTYDGLAHKGMTVVEQNATFQTHVAGKNIKIPEGYIVYQAFYHLRGGLQAQRMFYEIRTKALQDLLNISFSKPDPYQIPQIAYQANDLVRLEPSLRRAWSQKNDIEEYIAPHKNQSKSKAVKSRPTRKPSSERPSEKATAPIESDTTPIESEDNLGTPIESEDSDMDIDMSPTPKTRTLQVNAHQEDDSISLPDSEFELKCRCGLTGNGNILYQEEEGMAIQCELCDCWSHIACQLDGSASNLTSKDHYICTFCNLTDVLGDNRRTKSKSLTPKEREK